MFASFFCLAWRSKEVYSQGVREGGPHMLCDHLCLCRGSNLFLTTYLSVTSLRSRWGLYFSSDYYTMCLDLCFSYVDLR